MTFHSWDEKQSRCLRGWWRNLVNELLIEGRDKDAVALFEEFDLDSDLKSEVFKLI